ncbi:MAG: hypothetical protein E6R03_01365 [Hyphomicrobiaceae bacterium]|nr:MAG: hypothetical protein E6R03_01365 [Hyphomicrobiaceae bacterium]
MSKAEPGVFQKVLDTLDESERELYDSLRLTRHEKVKVGDTLVVFRVTDHGPVELDRLTVADFMCTTDAGPSTELRSEATGETLVVGTRPIQLLDHPAFVFLPTTLKLSTERGWIGFNLVLRTQAIIDGKEHRHGVLYVETLSWYENNFVKVGATN